jgi:DNA-binding MarR family transcriptional regulator
VARQDSEGARPAITVEAGFEETWPDAAVSATECVLNVYVLAGMIERASHAWVREQGLPSLAAMNVLTILHGADGPLQPHEISARMMVTRGTLTGILDTLERGGLVRRSAHGDDGRRRLVTMTRRGRRRVEELRPHLHRAERHLVGELSNDERATLLDLLARMQQAASTLTFD